MLLTRLYDEVGRFLHFIDGEYYVDASNKDRVAKGIQSVLGNNINTSTFGFYAGDNKFVDRITVAFKDNNVVEIFNYNIIYEDDLK